MNNKRSSSGEPQLATRDLIDVQGATAALTELVNGSVKAMPKDVKWRIHFDVGVKVKILEASLQIDVSNQDLPAPKLQAFEGGPSPTPTPHPSPSPSPTPHSDPGHSGGGIRGKGSKKERSI